MSFPILHLKAKDPLRLGYVTLVPQELLQNHPYNWRETLSETLRSAQERVKALGLNQDKPLDK